MCLSVSVRISVAFVFVFGYVSFCWRVCMGMCKNVCVCLCGSVCAWLCARARVCVGSVESRLTAGSSRTSVQLVCSSLSLTGRAARREG